MKNIIPSGDKLLSILECLALRPHTLQELAAKCEASGTTCYRALQTLLAHGWIFRSTDGLYDLSATFGLLAERCASNRLKRLKPQLEQLSRQCGLGAKLSIREGDQQLAYLRAESPKPFGVSPQQGARFPLAEGTVGAALLCDTPTAEIRRLCRLCPPELEEHDPTVVESRIATVQRQGWLFSEKLTRWNIFALSAPLRHGGTVVAAVTLIGLDDDFREPTHTANLLRQAAVQMEATLA